MGVIRKSVRPTRKSMGNKTKYKAHTRSGGLVNPYTQKTRSGIKIRVKGHIKKATAVKSSIRKRK